VVAEYCYTLDRSAVTNTTLSVVVEYGVYIPLLAYLLYRDNSHRYIDVAGINWKAVISDAKKLLATFSAAELVYTAIRGYMHYHFITLGMAPYQAAWLSFIMASIAFYTIINLGAKITRLFN
jgi:hypothetical protein